MYHVQPHSGDAARLGDVEKACGTMGDGRWLKAGWMGCVGRTGWERKRKEAEKGIPRADGGLS